MQSNLTLVLTRKTWMPGKPETNFREIRRHTSLQTAIKEIPTLADSEFEPLGIRRDGEWVWNS